MKLKDSKTYENLAKSFAGECQAHIRYKFIAYGARQEGYCVMADEIDKIVTQEFNHARMFYTKLQQGNSEEIKNISISSGYPFKEKWDLQDNLKLAAEDEEYEQTKTYPEYMKIASEEGFDDIDELYRLIIEEEKSHRQFFLELHKQFKDGTLYKKKQKTTFICSGCGHMDQLKEAWDICPLCKAKQGMVYLNLNLNNQN